MPSNSAKQARTMRAAAHSPEFARKVGIPQGVAREFVRADQRKASAKSPGARRPAKRTSKRKA